MKLLFLSTPVGALGSGLGGGVELTIYNIAMEMRQRGHTVTVVAPQGSQMEDIPIAQISGNLQLTAQSQLYNSSISIPPNSVLGNMWAYAREVQKKYDLIVNFAFDWLPFYLTPFFSAPIAHFVSMGSLSEAMDREMVKVAEQFPGTIGVYTRSQADTFPNADRFWCLGSGIDLRLYEFCEQPQPQMAWVARISPEKGLEDAVAAAQTTGIPLKVLGKMQDEAYWQRICQQYPQAPVDYVGFFPTAKMQQHLRQCQALLMTPRWVEAFGNVAIEALACGVPVISYSRGGPAEIIEDGKTGWLVEPDNIDELIAAIAQLDRLDRRTCRQVAEEQYSLTALGDRFEDWFFYLLDTFGNQQLV